MPEAPQIRIVRGRPTPAEATAVWEAILRLWREDHAAAVREAVGNPWVLAARTEATRAGPLRDWRLSSRIDVK